MEVTRVLTINLTRKLTTEQVLILNHLTHSAAKPWNVANYHLLHGTMTVTELEKKLKDNFWYKNLHSQSAQAVLQKLTIAWINFFKQHAKRPRFQPKDGHFPVKWKKDGFKIIRNSLRLSLSKQTKHYLKETHGIESQYPWVELPKVLPLEAMRMKEVEIVPHDVYGERIHVLHLIYKKVIVDPKQPAAENERVMAIDLGVKNLATVVIEGDKHPLIFDGRLLLSQPRWFAKETARSKVSIAKHGLKTCRRVARLTVKERNHVRDYLHKVSRWIVEVARQQGVTRIIIGDLTSSFSTMDLGRKNNEKFHRIPFGQLIHQITYKAKEVGITVSKIDEKYTSQQCSTCGLVKKSNRKHRGLYACSRCDSVMNADVNGARNMSFRVVPNPARDRDGGLGNPRRVRVVSHAPTPVVAERISAL